MSPVVEAPADVTASRPATVVPDAAPGPAIDGRPVLRVSSPTCAERQLGAQIAAAFDAGAAGLACYLPDGGRAWAVGTYPPTPELVAYARATLASRTVAVMTPAQRAHEVEVMEAEARRGDGWVTAGLVQRAPDRTRGSGVRLEGTVTEASEAEGETRLVVTTDLVGRSRFEIVVLGIADDRVVAGARVRIYGVYTGTHDGPGVAGEPVAVPQVVAIAVVPLDAPTSP